MPSAKLATAPTNNSTFTTFAIRFIGWPWLDYPPNEPRTAVASSFPGHGFARRCERDVG
jgi:hypothetical protein